MYYVQSKHKHFIICNCLSVRYSVALYSPPFWEWHCAHHLLSHVPAKTNLVTQIPSVLKTFAACKWQKTASAQGGESLKQKTSTKKSIKIWTLPRFGDSVGCTHWGRELAISRAASLGAQISLVQEALFFEKMLRNISNASADLFFGDQRK